MSQVYPTAPPWWSVQPPEGAVRELTKPELADSYVRTFRAMAHRLEWQRLIDAAHQLREELIMNGSGTDLAYVGGLLQHAHKMLDEG